MTALTEAVDRALADLHAGLRVYAPDDDCTLLALLCRLTGRHGMYLALRRGAEEGEIRAAFPWMTDADAASLAWEESGFWFFPSLAALDVARTSVLAHSSGTRRAVEVHVRTCDPNGAIQDEA